MRRTQVVADVVTICVGLVVAGALIFRPAPSINLPVELLEEQASATGQYLEIEGIDWSVGTHTLVMSLDSECVFCGESMPFYRRVQEHDRADVQIVVTAPFFDTAIHDYLALQEIKPDSVVLLQPEDFLESGTPTLLLVDSEGLVTHAWIGLLDPNREEEVLEVVFG